MGLRLPAGLIEALSWVGCTWPEADETKLFQCGEYWGDFAEKAAAHAEVAAAAVEAMLAENSSPGLEEFKQYWEKLSGESGYLVDCGIVAGAVSIAFYTAGGLVLTLKILVIVQLIAFAVILAAAIAAAFFTLGASLAAAAEIAVTVNRAIVAAVLDDTELTKTYFYRTDLRGARLRGARMDRVGFDADVVTGWDATSASGTVLAGSLVTDAGRLADAIDALREAGALVRPFTGKVES